jgi:hypothetical protein
MIEPRNVLFGGEFVESISPEGVFKLPSVWAIGRSTRLKAFRPPIPGNLCLRIYESRHWESVTETLTRSGQSLPRDLHSRKSSQEAGFESPRNYSSQSGFREWYCSMA